MQLERLNAFLKKLEASRIHFALDRVRDDFVMVQVAVPGERWEVEFGVDGDVEVEIFRSDGTIHDEAELGRLLSEFRNGDDHRPP